ncbi:hypothetical protein DVU_1011 [Nitratidesulfovibrio vulgaris str. Hildenborough]|uniref:Uncharacterized protein n=1 Tax=Nitratidesulfovibrio vulgaris (strain ATCC 29579 / DSM 644 / CCUG 34227 / NCIMB 8303 / VKM B-1760 / Hildenborough) TaxID=882 RepID=Q72DB8_NITV2|nr:hypothetical protein DVU_1011 [Nitratidesulfovibrio vulgaris str. Hildenborough]
MNRQEARTARCGPFHYLSEWLDAFQGALPVKQ